MADNEQRVYVGGDKKAHALREEIIQFLKAKGMKCVELGSFEDDETSYDRIKSEVEEKVHIEEPGSLGVLVFGTQEKKSEEEKPAS